MSDIQDKAMQALTPKLEDLLTGTAQQAISLVSDVAQGDGLSALETLVGTQVFLAEDLALTKVTDSVTAVGDALNSLSSATTLQLLESGLADVLDSLDSGGSGFIADLVATARSAIDDGFDTGSALELVQQQVFAAAIEVRLGRPCACVY